MTASPEKLHELLTYCMEFAKIMLRDAGEFLPFGAQLFLSEEVSAVGGWNGDEHPAPQEIYQLLANAFGSAASEKKIYAAALAADVNIPNNYKAPTRDALRIHLESDNFCRFIYVPYAIQASHNKQHEVQYFEPFSIAIPANFFKQANA